MLHCLWEPALHSPVAPIAARILSSNVGERGPCANVKCGNYLAILMLYDIIHNHRNRVNLMVVEGLAIIRRQYTSYKSNIIRSETGPPGRVSQYNRSFLSKKILKTKFTKCRQICSGLTVLTHWAQTKCLPFCRRDVQMNILEWNMFVRI